MSMNNGNECGWIEEAELYGGALVCDMPKSFSDASIFREVPDHQEVWVDKSSDRSLVIEILEKKEVSDNEAIPFFLSDLASFNEALDPTVLSTRALLPQEVPGLPEFARCFTGVGEQTVAKFKEASRNRVRILAAVVRLEDQTTDILITFNDPVTIDPESSSHSAPVTSESSEAIFARILKSFRVVDWGLFG
eukprot:TRINITY_DN89089_c0_g1_i1.p1 TRINITY_DN89089_c0_g1~~TRINITY_DN89089_c0_g1_i1.p1  ORF type:complete len:203 (+),score=23.84 TRINITY_DN89089_c0_g1_i1:36-611(+)